jgi:DNA polymerase IIIc chi subunit
MNCEINFYQVDEDITRSFFPLLLKILKEEKKVLVFCQNQAQITQIDNSLWSYGRNKFIPHATIFDQEFDFKRQPILITGKEENSNKADYLIFLDAPSCNFVLNFTRAFYFFEEGNFEAAKKLAQIIAPENLYKKAAGKWQKFSF